MYNSYERNKIIALIYRVFQAEEWNYTKIFPPSYKEIEKVVESLESSAYEVKGHAESGRIMVCYNKDTKTYSYYLSLGEN